MDLYLDLSKGMVDKGHLVQRMVPIHGQNGHTYMAHRWVDPNTGQEVSNVHPNQKTMAPPSLKHETARHPNVDEHEAMKRMEKVHTKDVDWEKAHEGTKAHNALSKEFDQAQHLIDTGKHTAYSSIRGTDVRKVFDNVFKGMSKENIEQIFSDPKGEWSATLSNVSAYSKGQTGDNHVWVQADLDLKNKEGKNIGYLTRIVTRKEDGLHVENDVFEVYDHNSQNVGLASTLYARSEDLWKHLSGGHPIHIHLTANISVGVYAWAKKGFDFTNENELRDARNDLEDWCYKNKIDLHDTLDKCGYTDVDDLKHSWQFASLDDGNLYKYTSNDDEAINGESRLGKAFMLGGKGAWMGVKHINTGAPYENLFALTPRNAITKLGVDD